MIFVDIPVFLRRFQQSLKTMILLELNHKKASFYRISLQLVASVYSTMKKVSDDEKFGLTSQIKRAAISIPLNIAEGSSRKSIPERKRFYEIARSSAVELDTGLEILLSTGLIKSDDLEEIAPILKDCFRQLSNILNTLKST